jgi:hypothetical protein
MSIGFLNFTHNVNISAQNNSICPIKRSRMSFCTANVHSKYKLYLLVIKKSKMFESVAACGSGKNGDPMKYK